VRDVLRSDVFPVRWTSPQAREGTTYDLRVRVGRARGRLPAFSARPQHTDLTTNVWYIGGHTGATYCFEARTIDVTGPGGPWSDERCVTLPLDDGSLKERGRTWSRLGNSHFYEGTVSMTTLRGATLRARGLRATGLALLVEECPTCGRIAVLWRDHILKTFDLRAQSLRRHVTLPIATFGRLERGGLVIHVTSSRHLVPIHA